MEEMLVILTVMWRGEISSFYGTRTVTGMTRREVLAWAQQQMPSHLRSAPIVFFSAEPNRLVTG